MTTKISSTSIMGTYRNLATGEIGTRSYTNWQAELLQSDSTTPGIDHPFRSKLTSFTGSILSGSLGYAEWHGCPSAMPSFPLSFKQIPVADLSRALAGTNPGSADTNVPVFAYELKDVPDMIRQAGRFLLAVKRGLNWRSLIRAQSRSRDIASANLAFQFGWSPLVGDLHKLATLQNAVDKRRERLVRLHSPKGLSRRITLGGTSESLTSSRVVWSSLGASVTQPYLQTMTTEQWATVRWKPSSNSYLENPLRPKDKEVQRILLGLTSQHITESIWEAIPWSWLVDYLVPIGSYLKANNQVVAKPSGYICVMTRRVTTRQYMKVPVSGVSSWSCTAGEAILRLHDRTLNVPPSLPTARIPVLGSGQLSVLGSLAILRAR